MRREVSKVDWLTSMKKPRSLQNKELAVKVEFASLLVHFSELQPLLLMRESCRVYIVDYYGDVDELTRGEMEQMCRGN